MSNRTALSIGLVAAALAFGGGSVAAEEPPAPPEQSGSAQSCAHHLRAMRDMSADKQREAYCQAHKDCMSHDCGGMAAKGHAKGPVDPPEPERKRN